MPSMRVNILEIPHDKFIVAVGCSTCRTMAFYFSQRGVDNAVMHHQSACSLPLVRIIRLMETEEIERALRAPIAE